MASGLSIVIDTRNAEQNIKSLGQALERLETQGNSVANMMRGLGGTNPFSGLLTAVTTLKTDFNGLATSANLVKSNVKEMGDSLVYAKTTLTGAATAATTFQAAIRGVGNSLNTAQAAMARFNQSGQSIATVLNSMNGASGSNGVNNLNNAIKQLNPNITVLNNETKAATASLRAFSTAAIAAEAATLKLDVALLAARANMATLSTTTVAADAALIGLQGVFSRLQTQATALGTSIATLNRNISSIPQVNNAAARSANTAAQSTALFQRSAQGLEATLMRLQTLMTGGLFGMMALSVAKTADAMQGLENQVRLVTQGEEQREEVQRRLLVIANKNFADIEATTGSYQRNAFALAQLGKSQMDVLNFTDALSLAMRTGGRSALEQKSAVYQLSQAMGAGKLMGDEFRALSENAPIILKYIAKEMGVAQGALKELGSEGKITSEIIYNAMMKARPEMEKMAQSLPVTMSQAWQQVNNSYKTFIDNFMNGTGGMSQGIAKALQGVAANFDTIIKGMAVAAGLAFVQIAASINVGTKAMGLFNLVMKANPIVLLATAVLGVASAFYGLEDVLNTTILVFQDFFGLVGTGLNGLSDLAWAVSNDISQYFVDSNTTIGQSYTGFFDNTEKGFAGFLQGIGRVVAAATSTLAGFFTWVGNGFWQALRAAANAFIWLSNQAKTIVTTIGEAITGVVNDAINGINGLIARANGVLEKTPFTMRFDVIGNVQWRNPNYQQTPYFEIKGQTLGQNIGNALDVTMPIVDGYFGGFRQRLGGNGVTGQPANLSGMMNPQTYQQYLTQQAEDDKKDKEKKKKEARDLLQGEIADAIQWAAAHLKINPNDLAAVISFETGGTFSTGKKNPGSSATGLIQFMEYADNKRDGKYYGYTRNQFAALSPNEQMKYVVEYLQKRGIGQGSGVGDIYDAVAGYGYRKGTKAYEQNRVWDANRDGYVAKGEAVTAKAFQPHIKNYFPNGTNLLDVGKVESDLAKSTAALDKARNDYLASILTGEAKLQAELDKQIADLPNKGFSGQALTDEEARLRKEYGFDLDLFKETNKRKLEELSGLQKTKRQMILDDAYFEGLQIAADESKSEVQRKAEIEAIDKRTKAQIGALDLEQAKKMADLNAYHTSAMRLILDRSNFAKAEIAANNEDLQTKLAQIAATEYEQRTAIFGIFDNQPNNPDRPKFFGYGAEGQYQQAMYDMAETQRIYSEGYAVLEQKGLLHSQTMIDFQTIYAEKVRQSNEAILEAERNVMSERLGIWSQGLDAVGSVWGQMTDIITNAYGKQSAAARAFFFIQKTIAAAQAIVNTEEAATKALAQGGALFGIPMATIVRASGYASAGIIMGQGIAGAFGKGFATGGYTGNGGVNDIAGVVHGKEYVLNAAATQKIGVDNLNRLNRGENIGSNVNIIIENHTGAPVQQRTDSDGNVRVIVGQELKRQVNDPNSDLNRGMKQNYQLQRKFN